MGIDDVIYSVNLEDVQNVAQQELGRALSSSELKIIEEKIGDQFDWYEAIASLIATHIARHESLQSN